ncbi:hypothetical protein BYT27DRAFT_7338921 [Phlegmacium glaucopus]|nr:hypothetical protein BYT27DRAFT_7338921 [Phlegmacium glaucopus]
MSPPSSAPFERSLYIGNAFGGILYGLQIYMVFHSCALLLKSESCPRGRKVKFYVIYGFVMLVLTTIALSANMFMGQYMWIEHRDFPGGPFSYYVANSTLWINILGTAACIVGNYMNDALLVLPSLSSVAFIRQPVFFYKLYRCYMIWDGNWRIVVAPFIIYLGTIATSLMALTESALPNSSFFVKKTTNFTIPWLSLTSGLNAIVTLLISGRILYFTRISSLAGRSPETRDYHTGIVAILVESSLPFTILGILCAIYFGKQQAPELAFAIVWGGWVPLSSQLIILRVAMGRAWTKETSSKFGLSSTMQFTGGETDYEGTYVSRSGSKNILSKSGGPTK